jgi:hypothetical protein
MPVASPLNSAASKLAIGGFQPAWPISASGATPTGLLHWDQFLPLSGRGSAWLERLVRDQEVGGSNPLAPTNSINRLQIVINFVQFVCDAVCDVTLA